MGDIAYFVKKILPVDLARQYKQIEQEANEAVLEVLSSGKYINGPVVSQFEEDFANYNDVLSTISCASGTDALYLALQSLKIGPGDEVITSSLTFIATGEVITRSGATPVFVDIDAETFNCNIDLVEAAITERTKAIIPVHLYGHAVDMHRVMDIAKRYGLYVVEDCAQATGAKWQGQRVGSFGDLGCFSFFPTKNLGGCGDGGAVTTNNADLAKFIRMLKEHGSVQRYCHEETGLNSRLDAIQAAILRVKLTYLDQWNENRRSIAQSYHRLLENIPGIVLPKDISGDGHVWNQYTIRVLGGSRDQLKEELEKKNISSMIYYPIPLHLQPVYRNLGYRLGDIPLSEATANEVLSLPMFPDLLLEEQEKVAHALKELMI